MNGPPDGLDAATKGLCIAAKELTDAGIDRAAIACAAARLAGSLVGSYNAKDAAEPAAAIASLVEVMTLTEETIRREMEALRRPRPRKGFRHG